MLHRDLPRAKIFTDLAKAWSEPPLRHGVQFLRNTPNSGSNVQKAKRAVADTLTIFVNFYENIKTGTKL